MKDFFEQLNTAKGMVNLPASRKDELRHRLANYMDLHPAATSHAPHFTSSLLIVRLVKALRSPLLASLTVIVVVLLIGGGATALAASNALPGSPLYPMKTGVLEPVQAAFKINDKARAEFEIELAARRVGEANILEARGELNEEAEEKLSHGFEGHFTRIESRIGNLQGQEQTDQAGKLTQRFIEKIEAQGRAGKTESKEDDSENNSSKDFHSVVQDKLNKAEARLERKGESRESKGQVKDVGDNNSSRSAADRLIAAENFLATVEKLIDLPLQLPSQSRPQPQARLNSAQELLAKAKLELQAGRSDQALTLIEQAMATATAARDLLKK